MQHPTRDQTLRGLLMVVLATPVCAGVVALLPLVGADMLATGEPIAPLDLIGGTIFVVGALAMLGISLRAVWRARANVAWRIYLAMLVVGVIVGLGAGTTLGLRIALEKSEDMAQIAGDLCDRFDERPDGCEERARACVYEVRQSPPVAERGVRHDLTIDPRAPEDPRGRAEWACLRRALGR